MSNPARAPRHRAADAPEPDDAERRVRSPRGRGTACCDQFGAPAPRRGCARRPRRAGGASRAGARTRDRRSPRRARPACSSPRRRARGRRRRRPGRSRRRSSRRGAAPAGGRARRRRSASPGATSASTSSRRSSSVPISTSVELVPRRTGKRVGWRARASSRASLPAARSPSTSSRLRVFSTFGRGRPAAARRRDGELHVPEPARRVRVGRADDLHAGIDRLAHLLVAEVEPVGQAVRLDRDALLERHLERALEDAARSAAAG